MIAGIPATPPISRVPAHRSPPLGMVGALFVVLFIASLVVLALMTGGAHVPTPYEPVEVARDYFTRHAEAARLAAFLQFGAAIPLGLFTATVTSRLRFLGMNVAGVDIALFGGFASSWFLVLSGLTCWALTQPGVGQGMEVVRALQLVCFATGGPGHVVSLGLLLAGVSVPSAFASLLPRWLVWLGLAVAVVAEFSTLCLILPAASVLLPLARFPALVWFLGAGFYLPRERRRRDVASARDTETESPR